eukprot:1157775-Pelagomonas_calceolata.AAC.9
MDGYDLEQGVRVLDPREQLLMLLNKDIEPKGVDQILLTHNHPCGLLMPIIGQPQSQVKLYTKALHKAGSMHSSPKHSSGSSDTSIAPPKFAHSVQGCALERKGVKESFRLLCCPALTAMARAFPSITLRLHVMLA